MKIIDQSKLLSHHKTTAKTLLHPFVFGPEKWSLERDDNPVSPKRIVYWWQYFSKEATEEELRAMALSKEPIPALQKLSCWESLPVVEINDHVQTRQAKALSLHQLFEQSPDSFPDGDDGEVIAVKHAIPSGGFFYYIWAESTGAAKRYLEAA